MSARPTDLQKWMRTNINEAYDFKKERSSGVEVTWEVYGIGSDPGWAHTGNKLNFVNSFKMKFAIIVGVIQMVSGVCTKLMNCLYFKVFVCMCVCIHLSLSLLSLSSLSLLSVWLALPHMYIVNVYISFTHLLTHRTTSPSNGCIYPR